MNAFEKD